MYDSNNPKWLNDALRTGDKIIRDGEQARRERRLREELTGGAPKATLKDTVEGIQSLIAGAVGIVGLFAGGGAFGWIGALVLGAGGFIGTVLLFGYLGDKMGDMAESRLWKNRPGDRTREDLLEYWEAKFGTPMCKELVDEIDLNGAAWVMDKKANFILRMHTGERLFIGHSDEGSGISIEKRGGKQFTARDAWRVMLARASAGSDACTVNGSKQAMAEMWAAAKILGIKVRDYEPDAQALEAYKRMEREFKEERP